MQLEGCWSDLGKKWWYLGTESNGKDGERICTLDIQPLGVKVAGFVHRPDVRSMKEAMDNLNAFGVSIWEDRVKF